jgi:hypothetical protein
VNPTTRSCFCLRSASTLFTHLRLFWPIFTHFHSHFTIFGRIDAFKSSTWRHRTVLRIPGLVCAHRRLILANFDFLGPFSALFTHFYIFLIVLTRFRALRRIFDTLPTFWRYPRSFPLIFDYLGSFSTSSGKRKNVYLAPMNHMAHNGPKVMEWYRIWHGKFGMVHNLAHKF